MNMLQMCSRSCSGISHSQRGAPGSSPARVCPEIQRKKPGWRKHSLRTALQSMGPQSNDRAT
eukprot:349939-Pelagomonas_calceolata.AAC.4